jgi:DNA-binding XRE family transcriptional regulator
MKTPSEFRPSRKSSAERLREKALREKLQEEKPSLQDLIESGECDADAVMTMGMYFDIQTALLALKKDRKRCGLSVTEVAERSGLDRAVVSRLENGKQDNPTIATLMRYAAALGKRFLWTYDDIAIAVPGEYGKSRRRRASRST